MQPNRPGSAKSVKTRITIDSQISSKDMNLSKFSQTYSNSVKHNNQKKKDFHNYVSQKSKDPKFKKFVQSDLPEIPQKPQNPKQLSKLTSKPFEKRSRVKQQPKVQQVEENKVKDASGISSNKKQNQSFVERNKNKLNSLKIGRSNSKMEKEGDLNKQIQNQNKQQQNKKAKISFNGFTVKQPGKPTKKVIENKQQEKVQNQKEERNKQEAEQMQRKKQLMELSRFIEDIQNRNVDYYPSRYQQFIQKNQGNTQIQKININDFMDDPNQKDYEYLVRKINDNQKMLANGQIVQNQSMRSSRYSSKSSSVNLDAIIDQTENQQSKNMKDDDNQSVALSSMTSSELKDRNMFLTQILKGRIKEEDVRQLKQNDESHAKLIKIEQSFRKQEDLSDDEVQMTKINMSKKKTTKIMQRNKIEAAGGIYRQCDYLTPQQQQRIEDLIEGAEIQSPFLPNQMEKIRERGVDEGIRIFRDMNKIQEDQVQPDDLMSQQFLPKDPILKKQAELKILKDKISSVNGRLRAVDDVVVNKTKIQNMVEKLKDRVRVSEMGKSLLLQKQREIQQHQKMLKQAQELIQKAEGQRQEINSILQELTEDYSSMERQVNRMKQMDSEQLRQLELKQIERKKKNVKQIQIEIQGFQKQITDFQEIGQEIQRGINQLNQIISFQMPNIECQNYKQDETIEDLDKIITRKWQISQNNLGQLQ